MLSKLSMWTLNMLGWSANADFPEVDKYVVIAAPHTSNWDFPLGIIAAKAMKLRVHWLGKHTLFRWPTAWFFRAIGGTPVQRDKHMNYIQQMVKLFEQPGPLVLALAPEGTRAKTDHWKSGFYHIARAAGVPIAMCYFDFANKRVGVGGTFYPGDDIDEDFKLIRRFYQNRSGKIPANESLIRAHKRSAG
jgi:1-acyl-sn-glycerol-3-phosphate acyltransferase